LLAYLFGQTEDREIKNTAPFRSQKQRSVVAKHTESPCAPCCEVEDNVPAGEIAGGNRDEQAEFDRAELPESDPVDHRPLE
jgi:hypothetical protein